MMYIIIAVVITISSCRKDAFLKDDELSIKRTDYIGNQLKINGYYYTKYGSPELLTIYVLFNNGTLLHTGDAWEYNKLNEFEQMIQSQDFINKLKDLKDAWGTFIIEQNKIKFERWYPSQPPLKAYVSEGLIVNDTTFIISEVYREQGGKKTDILSVNEIHYFKPFSSKPDSTNKFVQ